MKILFKAYLVGLVPGSLISIISNFDVAQATVNFKLSWWNVYLLVSYLVFLPLLYRARVNLWQMSDRVTKQVTQPRPHADQEAMRLGSNFANTGLFGDLLGCYLAPLFMDISYGRSHMTKLGEVDD